MKQLLASRYVIPAVSCILFVCSLVAVVALLREERRAANAVTEEYWREYTSATGSPFAPYLQFFEATTTLTGVLTVLSTIVAVRSAILGRDGGNVGTDPSRERLRQVELDRGSGV